MWIVRLALRRPYTFVVMSLAILLLGAAREVSIRWRHRAVAQQLKSAQARVAELEAAQPTMTVATPALTGTSSGETAPKAST